MNLTLRLFLLGAAFAVVILLPLRADEISTASLAENPEASAGTSNSQVGQNGQTAQGGKQHLLAQLGLSDAQKQQIKQIRATVTDKPTRRKEIWQILTPGQRETLKSLRQQRQAAGQGSATNQ